MTEYRLENGDKIEAQNYYRTKDGSKALVGKIYIVHGFATCLLGIIFTKDGQFRETAIWGADGKYHIHPDEEFNPEIYDLISLWPSESVTKCDQLGKIEVTNDIMQVASTAFCNCKSLSPNEKKPIILYNYRMKAALEAVFTHIANNKEKPNSSIWDSFPPELPILDKQDNDSWVPYSGAEEKKEPKKQTLSKSVGAKFSYGLAHVNCLTNAECFELISEYLEENN